MKYGKIYFYDRAGNKIADQKDRQKAGRSPPRNRGEARVKIKPVMEAAGTKTTKVPGAGFEPRTYQPEANGQERERDDSDAEFEGNLSFPVPHYHKKAEHHSLPVDDDGLCEQCRWREMQLALVAAQQDQIKKREKQEQDAVAKYIKDQQGEVEEKEKENMEKTKRLQIEIREFNKSLAGKKPKAEKELVESEESGGYLLYKRPDTAALNRMKQKSFHEELTRQVQEKQAAHVQLAQEERQIATKQYSESFRDVVTEETKDKMRAAKAKVEYRRALEAQIANKAMEDIEKDDVQPWWAKRPMAQAPTEYKPERVDQNERYVKQQIALNNLETFVSRQKEQDDRDRESRLEERRSLAPVESHRSGSVQSGRSEVSEAAAERQRVVEEAWRKANEEQSQKREALRKDQGGALMDQLRQYRRCRKCHKAIVQHDEHREPAAGYWYDVPSGPKTKSEPVLQSEGVDTFARVPTTADQIKSRHVR